MNYIAGHIRRFPETGRIGAPLGKNRVPVLLATRVPAGVDCGELKDRTCADGRDTSSPGNTKENIKKSLRPGLTLITTKITALKTVNES
jgi:hypothetical protein